MSKYFKITGYEADERALSISIDVYDSYDERIRANRILRALNNLTEDLNKKLSEDYKELTSYFNSTNTENEVIPLTTKLRMEQLNQEIKEYSEILKYFPIYSIINAGDFDAQTNHPSVIDLAKKI